MRFLAVGVLAVEEAQDAKRVRVGAINEGAPAPDPDSPGWWVDGREFCDPHVSFAVAPCHQRFYEKCSIASRRRLDVSTGKPRVDVAAVAHLVSR